MSDYGKAVRDMSRAATKKAERPYEGDGLTLRDLRCGDKVLFNDAGSCSLNIYPEGRIVGTNEEWSAENHRFECTLTVGFHLSPSGSTVFEGQEMKSCHKELTENQAIEFIFHAERAAFEEPKWLAEGKGPGR